MSGDFGTGAQWIKRLDLDLFEKGSVSRCAIPLVHDGTGNPIWIPALVARGAEPGPVMGISAAVHGNEVNGIPVIQKLFRDLDPEALAGTVVGLPVVNMPAFIANEREMEGFDINRLFPGKRGGNIGEVYAARFVQRVLRHVDYLIDLHTASFGRANSLYVRADLGDPVTKRMARLQQPEIIVHNEPRDGTLRGAAEDLGIPAITVEVGNPLRFEMDKIHDSLLGVKNVLADLEMIDYEVQTVGEEPIECSRSFWIHAEHGGLLDVIPGLVDPLAPGERLATVHNVFGDLITEYEAPDHTVVVGKATNPICQTGARVVHLGIPRKRSGTTDDLQPPAPSADD